MMDQYLERPFDGSPESAARITDFAIKSDEVEIVLTERAVPFMKEGVDEAVSQLLLAGFLAGNARAQLRAGKRADDLRAGVEGELKIYRALKSRVGDPALNGVKLTSRGLEAMLDMEAKGELGAYLDTLVADGKGKRAGPAR